MESSVKSVFISYTQFIHKKIVNLPEKNNLEFFKLNS